jgi:hypothetical protein
LSVNHAQRAGSVPEMSAGYGALAIAFGQAGLAGVARRYVQRSIELAETTPGDVNGVAYAYLLAMVYASSRCDWELLDNSGRKAEALYADLGDGFRLASAQALQVTGALQRANYGGANAIMDKMAAYVATDAPMRVVGWVLDSKLQRDIALGQVARADVEARIRATEGVDSLVDRLMSCGTTASAWLRLGEPALALTAAEQGLDLLLGRAPVAGAGYVYGPLGVVEALLACQDSIEPQGRAAHATKTARACKMLKTYTQQVPSTRPRGYFLLACYAELKASRRQAMKLWRKAVTAAHDVSMPYDQAAALLALGQRLPPGNPELEQAVTIFQSLQVPVPQLFHPRT